MPPPKRFRVHSKNYFLTYPQCSLPISEALSQLQALNTPTNMKFIRVCQEQHEDGSPHLQVLIQFEGKYICMNNRLFDLVSPTRSAHFHPNIHGAKSSSDVKTYIEKDGTFIDWGEFQVDGRSARGGQPAINKVYAEALNASSKEDALQIIREKDPKSFVLQFHRLEAKLSKIFLPPPSEFVSKWDPSSFRVPDNVQQWVADNIFTDPAARPDRPIGIVIEGPSRVGKTEWARNLGPHNYLSGCLDFNKRVYRNDVAYNIIDNVDPKYLAKKHWRELLGAKHDWQTNCKYERKPVQIKGGIPSIVLCNPGRESSYKDFLDKEKNKALKEWTLKNVWFEFIKEPLFINIPKGVPHTSQTEEDQA